MGGTLRSGDLLRESRLRELADGALRRAALAAQLDNKADPRVNELIGQVCAVARDRGVRAEHVVLLLKEAWRELPEARSLPRHDAGDMLARAVTACIRAYYTRDGGHP